MLPGIYKENVCHDNIKERDQEKYRDTLWYAAMICIFLMGYAGNFRE
jgi:hypothetical protein